MSKIRTEAYNDDIKHHLWLLEAKSVASCKLQLLDCSGSTSAFKSRSCYSLSSLQSVTLTTQYYKDLAISTHVGPSGRDRLGFRAPSWLAEILTLLG